MAILLELNQNERKNIVGVFNTEADANAFLEELPFVKKESDEYAVWYTIPFDMLPELYVSEYAGWKYVFSRSSFNDNGDESDIDVCLTEVGIFEDKTSSGSDFLPGYTSVDGYIFPNDEVENAIKAREELYAEAYEFFNKMGRCVCRNGLGSEDGEYVLVSEKNDPKKMNIVFHLDPSTVSDRQSEGDFAEWIKRVESWKEKYD